ncbi:MAG: hypothetical protein R2736_22925 [Solirubrobacterales bacterium]
MAGVGAAVEREGIDCAYARNGVVMVARTPLEAQRFRATVDEDREWGWTPQDSRYLGTGGARAHQGRRRDRRFNAHRCRSTLAPSSAGWPTRSSGSARRSTRARG